MDVILDREQLYQDVWSTTVSAVGRKYNVADYDIRRACFALDVPTPVQGYWAKVRAGDAPPVPPLPRKKGASTYTCKEVSEASESPARKPKPNKPAKEKESLAEWVLKDRAKMQAQKSALPPPQPAPSRSMHLLPEDMIGLPRYIPLTFWAALLLGEHAPHYNTILRWVHEGRIHPQPIKVGKSWNVRKDAAYVPD